MLGSTPIEVARSSRKCAAKLGVDIGHLKISVKCSFNRLGVTLSEEIDRPFEVIDLQVVSDGSASQSQLEQVANDVAKYCQLAKLFRQAGNEIKEEWKKSS